MGNFLFYWKNFEMSRRCCDKDLCLNLPWILRNPNLATTPVTSWNCKRLASILKCLNTYLIACIGQVRHRCIKWLQLNSNPQPLSSLTNTQFSCSHLDFRFRPCFEQGAPWCSVNYRVWIHSETPTWHNKNI